VWGNKTIKGLSGENHQRFNVVSKSPLYMVKIKNAMCPKRLLSLFSRFIWILLTILIIPDNSVSQNTENFPKDSVEFIETLSQFLENRISESNEMMFEKFIHYWKSHKFTSEKKDTIISMANVMLAHGARREPHFTTMLGFMIDINNTDFETHHFGVWSKGFHHLLHEKKRQMKKITDYFQFTLHFVQSGSLYASRTRTWYASEENYRFHYDTTLKIEYPQTHIKCKLRDDSIQIFETSGVYYPFQRRWYGKRGKVTWERAGYSPDQVYAQLNTYQINMTKANYQADSVKFIHNHYFDKPILGSLEDQMVHIIKPQDAIYPVFNSYQKVFELINIYDNIDYIGGFKMKGAQFIGTGGTGKDARVKVHRDGKVFMTARSETFILKKKRALSQSTSITIHLEEDSIYHMGLLFTYNVGNQNIELNSTDKILSKSVYYNTYHQVSMKFDRLLWNTNDDKIYMTYSRNSTMGHATFTSMNYFTLDEWIELAMRDRKHPLIAIRNYRNKMDSRKFDAGEYAKYMRLPTHQVRHRLMFLAQDGFIFYNLDADTVTINDKLFDYIQARIEKIDYDVIRINSNTKAPTHNAVLDLSNMDLNIRGVRKVFVSDSQNVVIYPNQNGITMKKNRHFNFGGVVEGGLFTFFGDSMAFDYENFTVAMNTIDSLNIEYKTDQYNGYGQKLLSDVQNTINDLTGVLHIDNPNNKSGKENFPQYPIFEGKKKSYVYYDDLFNGPYKRENFYFELYPFTMDSLDNFNPDNMKFKGNFRSAGIFPPFEETLVLRDDNSLGFEKTTTQDGLPLYDGKGHYYQEIDMSNRGLKGQGKLTYLTSTAVTDDILFFPDSTSIYARDFTIDQKTTGIEYPDVASKGVNIQWYPQQNDMHLRQTDNPFSMYNNKSSLEGYLNLKPTGLRGKGMLDMRKATLKSNYFQFEGEAFDADTANFVLRTLSKQEVAFRSDTLNGHIDYNYQRARFNTVNIYSISEFPQNLYLSYLDEFVWKMDENILEVESTPEEPRATLGRTEELKRLKDGDMRGALFLSEHKAQDSLRFTSRELTYHLADTTMKAKQVEYIIAADAKIFPDEDTLNIRKNASMDTLRNAQLVADREQKLHNIFNANIKIKGRYDYGGNGDYHYQDMNEHLQTIHFNEIRVNKSIQTYARGMIEKTDSFKLSPYFAFAGDVELESQRKLLKFLGGTKMTHRCSRVSSQYVYFESVINPDRILIPIEEKNRNLTGKNLFAGSYVTLDSTHAYSAFLTPRKDPSDDLIISSRGFLNFDEQKGKYQVASRPKLEDLDTKGTYISLDRDSCQYYAEGSMYLGVDFGNPTITPAGQLYHNLPANEIKFNLTLPLNFYFSEAAIDSMIKDINGRDELENIATDAKLYRKNLNEIVGQKTTDAYMELAGIPDTLSQSKGLTAPKALNQTFLFSNLQFEWHTSTNSYVAEGNIPIAMINGKPVNKKVDGFIEIIKQKHNDRLYIYIKPDNDRYYLFYYSRGIMRTYSNNKKFVDAINEVPKRKREVGGGLFSMPTYRYILATQTIRARFQQHIQEVKELIRNKE